MSRVKTLIIFSMAVLYLPVITRSKEEDDLVFYSNVLPGIFESALVCPGE